MNEDGLVVPSPTTPSEAFQIYRQDMNKFVRMADKILKKGGLNLENITQMVLLLLVAQAKDTGQLARLHSKSLESKLDLLLKCWKQAEEQHRRSREEELELKIKELEELLHNVQTSINTGPDRQDS